MRGRYKRHKLVAHDREEKFNIRHNSKGGSPRYKHKKKPKRSQRIFRYQYVGRGRWERVDG